MRLDLMKVLVVFALIGAVATVSNAQEKSVETWWSDSNVYITPGGDEGARAVIAGDIRPQVQQLGREVNQLKAGQSSKDMVTNEQAIEPADHTALWVVVIIVGIIAIVALILALLRKQGPQGEKGDRGEPGPQGIPGRDGLPGRDGRDGTYAMVSDGQGGMKPSIAYNDLVDVTMDARKAADAADKKAEQALKVAHSASELAQRNRERIRSIGQVLSGVIGAISDIRAWQKGIDKKVEALSRFARVATARFVQLFVWATALEINQVFARAEMDNLREDVVNQDFGIRCVGSAVIATKQRVEAVEDRLDNTAESARRANYRANMLEEKVEVLTDFASATVDRPTNAEFYRRRGITDRLKRILDGER